MNSNIKRMVYVLLWSVIFVSCSRENCFETPSIGKPYIECGDKLYFTTEQDDVAHVLCLSKETMSITNLCDKSMCTHSDKSCPLYIPGLQMYGQMAVDRDEYGNTILYIIARTNDDDKVVMKDSLFKYNTTNGKREILVSEWDKGSINTPTLWKNYIFFESLSIEPGNSDIYRMNVDGSGLKNMTQNTDNSMYILAIDDEKMILFDDYGYAYVADDNFKCIEKLIFKNIDKDEFCGFGYYKDKYLYYFVRGEESCHKEEFQRFNWNTMNYEDEFTYKTYDMYRIRESDYNAIPELICRGTVYSRMMLLKENTYYTVDIGHRYIGTHMVDIDGQEFPAQYIAYNNGIKTVDLSTKQETILFQNSDYNIAFLCAETSEFIVFRGVCVSEEYIENQGKEFEYFIYNRKEGKIKRLSD